MDELTEEPPRKKLKKEHDKIEYSPRIYLQDLPEDVLGEILKYMDMGQTRNLSWANPFFLHQVWKLVESVAIEPCAVLPMLHRINISRLTSLSLYVSEALDNNCLNEVFKWTSLSSIVVDFGCVTPKFTRRVIRWLDTFSKLKELDICNITKLKGFSKQLEYHFTQLKFTSSYFNAAHVSHIMPLQSLSYCAYHQNNLARLERLAHLTALSIDPLDEPDHFNIVCRLTRLKFLNVYTMQHNIGDFFCNISNLNNLCTLLISSRSTIPTSVLLNLTALQHIDIPIHADDSFPNHLHTKLTYLSWFQLSDNSSVFQITSLRSLQCVIKSPSPEIIYQKIAGMPAMTKLEILYSEEIFPFCTILTNLRHLILDRCRMEDDAIQHTTNLLSNLYINNINGR